jgi:hypothetical protein
MKPTVVQRRFRSAFGLAGRNRFRSTDQERAKEFWTTAVGFDLVRDESHGDERWIEVQPLAAPSGSS